MLSFSFAYPVLDDDPANLLVLWQCYTENFPCYENSLPSCHNAENTSAFPILRIPARTRRNSPHYSPHYHGEIHVEHSLHYGWPAENWEYGEILRVRAWSRRMRRFSPCYLHIIAEMPIKCWDYTTLLSKKIPSAFSPHFFSYKNAEISRRSCPNNPICIFSARKMRRSGV